MSTTCVGCGEENRAGRRFCAQCGKPLVEAPVCGGCGAGNEPGERFCGDCGTPLLTGVAPASPRKDREGERKQLTVLFADVQGSMELQESLDPDTWAEIMGRFVQILSDGVQQFGGTVDKFTGDGIMALFGAPVAQEDHARRACHTALRLISDTATHNAELRASHGMELHVRLGLNSGEVVVGRLGEDTSLDPTALGHTVGLAQRMESLAEPDSAYLTEHTARLVERWFGLRDLGPRSVKGARAPLRVFALDGPSAWSPASRAGTTLGSAPLVGRGRELAALEDALALARQQHAQVVGIVGEAGVGKSRLCEEFARRCREEGLTVRRAAGISHGQAIPLLPVVELLRDYFMITAADASGAARERVAAGVLRLDPDLADELPLLFDFLEVPDPDRPPPRLGPEARMRRIFGMLRRITQRRSERELLVLVLEDLHWFDPQSRTFLDELISYYPGTRTLVLVTFRPEFHSAWMGHSYYRQLPLAALAPEAVTELVGGLLGHDRSLAGVSGYVLQRAGGNPFFIEEIMRSLIEDGTLAGEPGDYRLCRSLSDARIPVTVQAVLAARIDRLDQRDKALLQMAAVAGRFVSETVLAHLWDQGPDDLTAALGALCAAEFFQRQASPTGVDYCFWHALTQEVAYRSLLAERRGRLHGAVAGAIIELDADRLDERAALIATHYELAGDDLEAARWNARAAAWALRTDQDEARRRWRSVLGFLGRVPEDDETIRLGVSTRSRLLQFGARAGISHEEADRLHAEGRSMAEKLSDPEALITLSRMHTTVQILHGELGVALFGLLEVARLSDETGDVDLRVGVWSGPAFVYPYTGPLDEGLRVVALIRTLAEGDTSRGVRHLGYSPLVLTAFSCAEMLARAGRLEEARQEAHQAIDLAQRCSVPEWLAACRMVHPFVDDRAGEDRGSSEEAAQALRLAEDLGSRAFYIWGLQAVGISHLIASRWSEAAEILARALDDCRGRRTGLNVEGSLLAHLARAELELGSEGQARDHAREAVEVTRRQGAPVTECLALLTRAQIARRTGDPEAARDGVRAGLIAVDATKAFTYEPFLREEQARLDGDRAALRAAAQRYAEIGASGHARRLEAELSTADLA